MHFLWYAALMEGRGDLALDTARQMGEHFPQASTELREYIRVLPVQTLVRFERWDEILALQKPAQGLGLSEGIWEYARGVAFAHTGRVAEAQQSARNLAQVRQLSTLSRARIWNRSMFEELLQISAAVLDGGIAFAPGHAATAAERTAAIEALQRAATLEDQIGGEPPRWGVSARLELADALRADGRAADAEREYREHLRRQRDNGWALSGLREALAAQGKTSEARALDERLRIAWAHADATLR
jgi:tetratricopeptide (TPR) repeat protein